MLFYPTTLIHIYEFAIIKYLIILFLVKNYNGIKFRKIAAQTYI